DQQPAHGRRPGLRAMRLRPLLPDDLADLEISQLRDHPGAKHQADGERGQAGSRRAEGDVAHHPQRAEERFERRQQVVQHQANSAAMRSATMSVRVPRDPLTRTRSPALTAAAMSRAAASLFSAYRTADAGIPAAIAASASARAGAPPMTNSRRSPAAAAAVPESRCSGSECSPSSSISPRTATFLDARASRPTTSSAAASAEGLELYESSIRTMPPRRRRTAPRRSAGFSRSA